MSDSGYPKQGVKKIIQMAGGELKYPAGQQDFQKIRESGKVYVDKTELIYKLIKGAAYVFLSRPRRFGKSLLLSTIKAYFEGKKELFEGLEIMNLEKEWKSHPVIHLEFSGINPRDPDGLESSLRFQFENLERRYEATNEESSLSARFRKLVMSAYEKTGRKVAVLIDEYDNPLVNTLHLPEQHENNRELLKSIYSNLKPLDEYIEFAMLTGVSRFSRTSIFSGLNNLTDITFDPRYSSICGFTEEEIHRFLLPGVDHLAAELGLTTEQALGKLKDMYDGYHFSEKCPDIYNPYSLILALEKSKIGPYWFETGTPGFLATRLKGSSEAFSTVFNAASAEKTLAETDTAFSSPVSLLYQTGYLTIKGYDSEKKRYLLDVPNKEVEESLFPYLLSAFSGHGIEVSEDLSGELAELLRNGKPDEFLRTMKAFISAIPYDIIPVLTEKYFQHLIYLTLRIGGMQVEVERKTSFGRSDIITTTENYIYIFELKLDGSAGKALNQIEEKGYAAPYHNDTRKIFRIGLNFSSQTRTISDWLIN